MKQFEIFIKNQDIMPYPPTNFFNLFQFYFANTNIILIFASAKNISVNTVEEHRLTALKYYEHFLCSKVANIWLPILYLFALRSVLMFLANGIWQPFFCLNAKNIKTMKTTISLRKSTNIVDFSKVAKWLKSKIYQHAFTLILTFGIFAMGSIEADSYITAAVCLIGLVITTAIGKEASHGR